MEVENNFNWECCPVCYSSTTKKHCELSYNGKINFATTEIKIINIPELWRCSACLSFFVQNVVSEENAVQLYINGCSDERWSNVDFENNKPPITLNVISTLLNAHNSVLDVGCNTGELLDYSKKFGCATTGVELSGSSRTVLKKKGHQVFKCLEDVTGSFDLIVAFDLIEHLYSVPDFLETCNKLLDKKGELIFLTGNPNSIPARFAKEKWWYMQYPEHIVFPSRFFYKNISWVKSCKFYNTYASVGYISPIIKRFKVGLRQIAHGRYNGLPALCGDHHLVVLKRC